MGEDIKGIALFVDDEANILAALSRELRAWSKRESLAIKTANSSQEALDFLEASADQVRIVVSDLKMPVMLGSDLLLKIREKWPNIVTILLTGYSEAEEVMKAVKAGIYSYILKPWDSEYLQNELTKALESRRIREQNEQYARTIEDELRWAGEMQRALLRPTIKNTNGVELRVSYRPVPGLYCGGDYYDVVNLGPDRFLILIGDVAGHGLKAAFITGILKAIIFPDYIRDRLTKRFSPAEFLSWLNDRLNTELSQASGMLVTFFAAVLDLSAMAITYSNAGHNHPFVVSGWIPRELSSTGPALGAAASQRYVDSSISVNSGDVIIAYTDGLVEPDAARKGSSLDMIELLKATPYGQDFHKRLLDAALTNSGAKDFTDDVTLFTARLA